MSWMYDYRIYNPFLHLTSLPSPPPFQTYRQHSLHESKILLFGDPAFDDYNEVLYSTSNHHLCQHLLTNSPLTELPKVLPEDFMYEEEEEEDEEEDDDEFDGNYLSVAG